MLVKQKVSSRSHVGQLPENNYRPYPRIMARIMASEPETHTEATAHTQCNPESLDRDPETDGFSKGGERILAPTLSCPAFSKVPPWC